MPPLPVVEGSAAEGAPAAEAPEEGCREFAPLILGHIFQFLPPVEIALTVSRLSKEWGAWSAPRAAALRKERHHRESCLVRLFEAEDPSAESPVPSWAVEESWFDLSEDQRSEAAVQAALHGDTDLLVWMEENSDYYWFRNDSFFGLVPKVCTAAARGGHLALLQWLRTEKRPSIDVCAAAARGGHLHVLRWLYTQRAERGESVCFAAAQGGHLEVLQWLRANRYPWDRSTCKAAAQGGHLEVLQFLRANGCPWDKAACTAAAERGHLAVLQFLHANGCPWDERACTAAAERGHLAVLQFLHASGCPWDEAACTAAARGGHLAVLRWLYETGCPMDVRAIDRATKERLSQDAEMRAWLEGQGLLEQWCQEPSSEEEEDSFSDYDGEGEGYYFADEEEEEGFTSSGYEYEEGGDWEY